MVYPTHNTSEYAPFASAAELLAALEDDAPFASAAELLAALEDGAPFTERQPTSQPSPQPRIVATYQHLIRYRRGKYRVLRGSYDNGTVCYKVQVRVCMPVGSNAIVWATIEYCDFLWTARAKVRALHDADCKWTEQLSPRSE
jgi:hypothetical protein